MNKETLPNRKYTPIRSLTSIIFILIFLISPALSDKARKNVLVHKKKIFTIILDPGHGGNNTGITGNSGLLEKDITLKLAKLIEAKLETDYRVLLTRKTDYNLTEYERTSKANNQQGDLFISLHLGGGFLKNSNYITISYFDDRYLNTDNNGSLKTITTEPSHVERWDHVYLNHIENSQRAAEFIKNGFHLSAELASQIKAYPVLVLRGVQMPALLIETGYLTNPSIENSMNSGDYLKVISACIVSGIKKFIENQK